MSNTPRRSVQQAPALRRTVAKPAATRTDVIPPTVNTDVPATDRPKTGHGRRRNTVDEPATYVPSSVERPRRGQAPPDHVTEIDGRPKTSHGRRGRPDVTTTPGGGIQREFTAVDDFEAARPVTRHGRGRPDNVDRYVWQSCHIPKIFIFQNSISCHEMSYIPL